LEALVISNVVLWISVVVLAGIVFALMRQIGVLHERVAPAGALVVGEGPKPGDPAPVLHLPDLNGRLERVGGEDPEGRSTLLFFLSPTCPICKTLLPAVLSIARSERRSLRVILASDGPLPEHETFVREHGLSAVPYLISTDLGLRYRVGRLPYAVLIDEAGVLRSRGLVNSREHLESLFEAKERGVASLQEFLHGAGEAQGAV
jgi:methylamine dehydrogenase accessory protein MauD